MQPIMRVLGNVTATPEQITVIQDSRPGVTLIRGAAGSGKTTTALLRLRFLADFWRRRRERESIDEPVQVLVLTYNRTLRGYIAALADESVVPSASLELEVSTFGKWSSNQLGNPAIVGDAVRRSKIIGLGQQAGVGLSADFLLDEVDYVTGRFLPTDLEEYVGCRREGRGQTPRMEKETRRRLLDGIVYPYQDWKRQLRTHDWNDLAVELAEGPHADDYDVLIVDEAQDFSANQVRALLNRVKPEHSITFVMDAVQRIYPRGFRWTEAGVSIAPADVFTLGENFRNTVEIASFARSVLDGVESVEAGALPDLTTCTRHGPTPVVVAGRFSGQLEYVVEYIKQEVDLSSESVAILQPRGGAWFDYTRAALDASGIPPVLVARLSEWPEGPENVALSTIHSAKGLEFDHVCILGLNAEVTPHGEGEADAQLENLRRLVGMASGRARQSLVVGYKPDDASTVVVYFDPSTFIEVNA